MVNIKRLSTAIIIFATVILLSLILTRCEKETQPILAQSTHYQLTSTTRLVNGVTTDVWTININPGEFYCIDSGQGFQFITGNQHQMSVLYENPQTLCIGLDKFYLIMVVGNIPMIGTYTVFRSTDQVIFYTCQGNYCYTFSYKKIS